MRIFVTGSASCLGKVVLPLLAARDEVEAITGIDIKPTAFEHPKFTAHIQDIRESALAARMQGHDAVLHLAFVIKRGSLTHEKMSDVNVAGGMNVVDAAVANGITNFVNLSSVSVYGSGIDLTEASRAAPAATFAYACHKAMLEAYVERRIPHAIQLRSHLIIGRHAQPFLIDLLRSPFWVRFNSQEKPRQQVVHEQDVAQAIWKALSAPYGTSGCFNLAAADVIDLGGEYVKRGRTFVIPVPCGLVQGLVAIMKRLRPRDEYQWVEILNTSLTVDCCRAERELGWVPARDAWQARRDALLR